MSLSTIAQNWKLVNDHDTIHFNSSDIHSLVVDSSSNLNTFEKHYFNRIINDSIPLWYMTNPVIQNYAKPNLLGDSIIVNQDSTIIKNQKNSTIILKHSAPQHSHWQFYVDSGRIFTATVDSVKLDSVMGLLDSVKHISFQCTDLSNNPLNHSVNSKVVKLSKNHGIVEIFNLYQFPDNASSLSGNIKYVRANVNLSMTRREFFNYSVGDEFHLKIQDYQANYTPNVFPNDFQNEKILAKSFSQNNDTVFYSVEVKKEMVTASLASSTGPLLTHYSYSTDTNRVFYTDLDLPAIKSLGYQPLVIDSATIRVNIIRIDQFNNRVFQQPYKVFYEKSPISFTIGWTTPPYQVENLYGELEGIGSFEGYRDWDAIYGSFIMPEFIYFKKGNEIWGSPRIIVNTEEAPISSNRPISIYPNPVENKLSLKLPSNLVVQEVTIFNNKGEKAATFPMNSKVLDVSNLKVGLYFIQLQTSEGLETLKFIKR